MRRSMLFALILLILPMIICGEAQAQGSAASKKASAAVVAPAKSKPTVQPKERSAAEIADALTKAKASYAEKLKEIRRKVGGSLDAATKAARQNKNAELIAQIDDERKMFAVDIIKVPKLIDGDTRNRAVEQILDARSHMEKEYGAAIGDYTVIAQDDEAKKLLAERQKFRDEMPRVKPYPTSAGRAQNGPVQSRNVAPPLPPQGNWKFRITIAPRLTQEGAVKFTGQVMYHVDQQSNPIGTVAFDGLGNLCMSFDGHRKIALGEAVVAKQANGYWTGTLMRADGTLQDFEMYR